GQEIFIGITQGACLFFFTLGSVVEKCDTDIFFMKNQSAQHDLDDAAPASQDIQRHLLNHLDGGLRHDCFPCRGPAASDTVLLRFAYPSQNEIVNCRYVIGHVAETLREGLAIEKYLAVT